MKLFIILAIFVAAVVCRRRTDNDFEKAFLICDIKNQWSKQKPKIVDNSSEKTVKKPTANKGKNVYSLFMKFINPWDDYREYNNSRRKVRHAIPAERKVRHAIPVSNRDFPIYDYDADLAHLVNLQIRQEMYAFYNYLSMSRFFRKYDYDLEGFATYFQSLAMEELEHAQMFMKYQAMRGGAVKLFSLLAPLEVDWVNGKSVLETAFALEKNITKEILCLHTLGSEKYKDSDFVNFLDDNMIPEQYQSMKQIKTHIMTLERGSRKPGSYPLFELEFDERLKEKK